VKLVSQNPFETNARGGHWGRREKGVEVEYPTRRRDDAL
jgi:hypothetical protein